MMTLPQAYSSPKLFLPMNISSFH